jgi:hypothetical protein
MKETYTLTVSVQIEKMIGPSYTGERMTVNQQVTIRAADFLGICKVLAEFQQLADRVKS